MSDDILRDIFCLIRPMKILSILFLSVFPVLWLPPPGVADVYVTKDKQVYLRSPTFRPIRGFGALYERVMQRSRVGIGRYLI